MARGHCWRGVGAVPIEAVEHHLKNVAQALLASYVTVGGMNHTEGENLPSKRAIASLCSDLLALLFPGFHDDAPQSAEDLVRATHVRVRSLAARLTHEICKSLRQDEPGCPTERAAAIAAEFLGDLPNVRRLLRSDVDAAFAGDPAASGAAEIILAYPGLEAIAIQRCAHRLYEAGVPLIPRMLTEWAHGRTGIDIHPGARIGTHFFIDHGTGVVIGETAVVGDHVRLYQGVSLIARSLSGGQALKGQKRHPTIEDRVTVYAGTTIMGGDTVVGSGSTVGGNVFLTHSLPPRSLAMADGLGVRVLDKDAHAQAASDDWMI
jgi:serine O-acetyltransferase